MIRGTAARLLVSGIARDPRTVELRAAFARAQQDQADRNLEREWRARVERNENKRLNRRI